jgi:hypothetical protein
MFVVSSSSLPSSVKALGAGEFGVAGTILAGPGRGGEEGDCGAEEIRGGSEVRGVRT